PAIYPVADDEQLMLNLLKEERILMVQGSAFNLDSKQHFRIVFLPDQEQLRESIGRFANFLERLRL
ncbi:aminotransferase, partial [Porticoccaceae bacterium]|nr:aminotransferase [Porticoccaceae bacterium]